MTIISANEIGIQLKDQFSILKDWEPGDREFVLVDYDYMAQLVNSCESATVIKGVWECEEIANAFIVDDRRRQVGYLNTLSDELQTRNRAIGRADGRRFRHVDEPHVVNLFISPDGIYLFDMQTLEIWKPTEKDEVYWVVMI